MTTRYLRLALAALLFASAAVSLGACNVRAHHIQKGAQEAF